MSVLLLVLIRVKGLEVVETTRAQVERANRGSWGPESVKSKIGFEVLDIFIQFWFTLKLRCQISATKPHHTH